MSVNEILEAVDKLPLEDQATLLEIVNRRRRAKQREALARDIAEARKEFKAGGVRKERRRNS